MRLGNQVHTLCSPQDQRVWWPEEPPPHPKEKSSQGRVREDDDRGVPVATWLDPEIVPTIVQLHVFLKTLCSIHAVLDP